MAKNATVARPPTATALLVQVGAVDCVLLALTPHRVDRRVAVDHLFDPRGLQDVLPQFGQQPLVCLSHADLGQVLGVEVNPLVVVEGKCHGPTPVAEQLLDGKAGRLARDNEPSD
jgi:hypothetical protein